MIKYSFEKTFSDSVIEGTNELIDSIKLILYKKHPSIFDELDFENDEIYMDPLLFACLNSKLKQDANDLLWGYKSVNNRPENTWIYTNEAGIAYLPNIGYFKTNCLASKLCLSKNGDAHVLTNKTEEIEFQLIERVILHDKFEVLMYPNDLLNEHFYDDLGSEIEVEVTEVTKKHLKHLQKALDIIEESCNVWYQFMKQIMRKFVIFESPTFMLEGSEIVTRNSFASQSVHGCAFFNAYQKDYNEVFFIEDIAHQCGHVIFNAFLVNKPTICKVDLQTQIYHPGPRDKYNEPRSLFEIIHAMYTYESIFTCFNGCLEKGNFEGHKKHELNGRLTFTLLKFKGDLELLSEVGSEGENIYFTQEGLSLIDQFKKSYEKCIANWGTDLVTINLENQPYNFSYSKFLKLNPLVENEVY